MEEQVVDTTQRQQPVCARVCVFICLSSSYQEDDDRCATMKTYSTVQPYRATHQHHHPLSQQQYQQKHQQLPEQGQQQQQQQRELRQRSNAISNTNGNTGDNTQQHNGTTTVNDEKQKKKRSHRPRGCRGGGSRRARRERREQQQQLLLLQQMQENVQPSIVHGSTEVPTSTMATTAPATTTTVPTNMATNNASIGTSIFPTMNSTEGGTTTYNHHFSYGNEEPYQYPQYTQQCNGHPVVPSTGGGQNLDGHAIPLYRPSNTAALASDLHQHSNIDRTIINNSTDTVSPSYTANTYTINTNIHNPTTPDIIGQTVPHKPSDGQDRKVRFDILPSMPKSSLSLLEGTSSNTTALATMDALPPMLPMNSYRRSVATTSTNISATTTTTSTNTNTTNGWDQSSATLLTSTTKNNADSSIDASATLTGAPTPTCHQLMVTPVVNSQHSGSSRPERADKQRQLSSGGGSLFLTSPRSFLTGRKPTYLF